ncbi:methyltransferase family protein [Allonocardiopsis opalescens]|uniref:Methyltransferase family protein n=1 Tax=Allonocardiopsis opalescens TaxID=1144618 RepID=A0A2T0QDC4_9ACTN|nr:methyltransferase family protein [Allonocardiopsis opalescens]
MAGPPTGPSGADPFSKRVRFHGQDLGYRRLAVLDAGCGLAPPLDLGRLAAQVVGVETDEPGPRERALGRTDLAELHLGDLRTVPLGQRCFDIVHASFVIERIGHAELVLDRLVAALRPGGLLLLRSHDRDSRYGVLDRALPEALRARLPWPRPTGRRGAGDRTTWTEWAAEFGVLGRGGRPRTGRDDGYVATPTSAKPEPQAPQQGPGAGDGARPPDRGPAVYEPVVSLNGVRAYAIVRDLDIIDQHSSRYPLPVPGLAARLAAALGRGTDRAGNRIADEFTLVLRKREKRDARVL